MKEEKHVLSMLVDNEPGVLSRIAGLFSGRGYNIESLCVAETMETGVSRLTIVTKANARSITMLVTQTSLVLFPVRYGIFNMFSLMRTDCFASSRATTWG